MRLWTNAYVGIPYADLGRDRQGCDCWGLARMIYACELGIELPSYQDAYVSAEERAEIAGLLAAQEDHGPWRCVEERARAFDLVLFRRGRFRSHIGVVIEHGWMLHMAGEDQAKVESLAHPRWASRLGGVYRHVQQCAKWGLQ